MKKTLSLASIILVLLIFSSIATANEKITIQIDGELQSYDQKPVVENGRTLVPLRGIFESLGATVQYDSSTKRIVGTKGETEIVLILGSKLVTVDGETVELDVAAKTINGNTVVPLRFVSTALGSNIEYDSKTQQISIVSTEGQLRGLTDVNESTDLNVKSSFQDIIEAGDFEKVKNLVENGVVDVNEKIPDGSEYPLSALGIAAESGNLKIVKYLVESGATAISSALSNAVREDHVEIALFLLEEGGDVDYYNGSLLSIAVKYRYLDMIRMLLENNADPNLTFFPKLNSLYHAVSHILRNIDDEWVEMPYEFEVVLLLVDHGAEINDYIIEVAISQDRLDALELFLDSGYDPNTVGRNGHPLKYSEQRGKTEAIELLKKYGASK